MTRRVTRSEAEQRMRRFAGTHRLWAMLTAMAMVLAACGGQADSGDATASGSGADGASEEFSQVDGSIAASAVEQEAMADTSAAAEAGEPAAEGVAAEGDAPSAPSGAGQTAGVTAADLNRQIIFTATVEVDVDDVAAAGLDAVDAIQDVGGFVFGQASTGGAEPRSVFTFKVRPADFDRALAALSGIGELRNQVIAADDVTERVVDLESRIQVAELGVERLRIALETATSLEDFAELERLLLARETDLEVMRGQIRTLQDQVDLATITLVLTQDRIENNLDVAISFYEEHNDGQACPGQPDNRVESGTDLTICFELVNTGDQALTDLSLTDTGLGIKAGPDNGTDANLIEVFGSLNDTLQPGQRIILAHEITPERAMSMRTVVGGQPVAIEGQEPAGPPVSTTRNATINVTPSTNAPGFGDGFESGSVVLSGIWSAVRVTVGFVLPLLALLPFLLGAGWLLRKWRRRPGRKQKPQAPTFGMTPPPPGSTPLTNVPAQPATRPAPAADEAVTPPPAPGGDAPA